MKNAFIDTSSKSFYGPLLCETDTQCSKWSRIIAHRAHTCPLGLIKLMLSLQIADRPSTNALADNSTLLPIDFNVTTIIACRGFASLMLRLKQLARDERVAMNKFSLFEAITRVCMLVCNEGCKCLNSDFTDFSSLSRSCLAIKIYHHIPP
jgi:hypothetical protein